MKKIIKGDQVIVITGKDKGKTGSVSRILANKIIVDGLNLVKKNIKANPNKNEKGGVISKEMPLDMSNVAIYNSELNKSDKIYFKVDDEGKRNRYFKSNGELVK